MRYRKSLLASVALLLFSGCGGTLNEKYVVADRAKFNAITPEYLLYVEADPELDDLEKKLRRHNVRMWKRRLEEAEKVLRIRYGDDGSPSIWSGEDVE